MINLGLKRTARLLDHIARKCFDQPHFQPSWKAAHIAGTNGKGSVAAYLSALLSKTIFEHSQHAQLRIGRFTSPHFIDRWDCIQIDNKPIAKDLFLQTERQVQTIAREVEQELRNESQAGGSEAAESENEARLTEFELLTATAFTLFSRSDPRPCDIAVIECGLGGRLDATNALPDSSIAVSILTRIGLDHLELLGGSLAGIVREKSGIFRQGVPVVVDGDNEENVLRMVQKHFNDKQTSSTPATALVITKATDIAVSPDGSPCFTTRSSQSELRPQIVLPHQLSNLAVSFAAFDILMRQLQLQVAIPEARARSQLLRLAMSEASKSYPARLQWLDPGWLDKMPDRSADLTRLNRVPALLDGAHNAQSAIVLRDYVDKTKVTSSSDNETKELAQQSEGRPEIWIIALSSTKPPAEIFQALFAHLQGDHNAQRRVRVILTSFGPVDGMPWVRASQTSELVACAKALGLGAIVHSTSTHILEALGTAEKVLRDELDQEFSPLIVIAGSLYLASDFMRLLRDGQRAFLEHWGSSVN